MTDMRELLKDSPIIAAVKDTDGLSKALTTDCDVIFVLFGDIMTIPTLVNRIKEAGKMAFVHVDLIEGLVGREIAIDFLKAKTGADGIISTRPNQIKYAKAKGLLTVQRFFIIDSIALAGLQKQFDTAPPDLAEVLPGLMPQIIEKLANRYPATPFIAGGLISTKADIMQALNAGAAAVSSTSPGVWQM
ncbi:MAG: glycerol-3-phosphate responsive antiterminator [Oscillospiraceae bacterium]|nr:glycerol-3-phosphate responsive antiterminator [Oscillospiraceae bacterium]